MLLKIGGHEVELILKPLTGKAGESDFTEGTITIDSEIKKQSIKESTLIHEINHFINTTFGCEGIEHAFLDSYSEQIYQVFKDNGLLNEDKLKEILNG